MVEREGGKGKEREERGERNEKKLLLCLPLLLGAITVEGEERAEGDSKQSASQKLSFPLSLSSAPKRGGGEGERRSLFVPTSSA